MSNKHYKEARGNLVKTDSLLIKEMPINLSQLIGPEHQLPLLI